MQKRKDSKLRPNKYEKLIMLSFIFGLATTSILYIFGGGVYNARGSLNGIAFVFDSAFVLISAPYVLIFDRRFFFLCLLGAIILALFFIFSLPVYSV